MDPSFGTETTPQLILLFSQDVLNRDSDTDVDGVFRSSSRVFVQAVEVNEMQNCQDVW